MIKEKLFYNSINNFDNYDLLKTDPISSDLKLILDKALLSAKNSKVYTLDQLFEKYKNRNA